MCELVGELLVQMGNRFKKVNEREGEKLTFEVGSGSLSVDSTVPGQTCLCGGVV